MPEPDITSPRQTPEVLVVGAGPSGLVAALTLLRNGVPVRIIDKAAEHRIGQRGAGIMPRSLELFHQIGVAHEITKRAITTPVVKLYEMPEGRKALRTFEMSPVLDATPSCPYMNILMLGQDHLEEVLRASLAEYGVQAELATEVVALSQTPDYATATIVKYAGTDREAREIVSHPFIIGTDGARGVCRKLLNMTFLGETRNVENLIIGDIMVEGLEGDYWHMWGDASTSMVSLRPTETPNLFNFMLAGKDVNHRELSKDEDGLRAALTAGTGGQDHLVFGDFRWVSHYRPNMRMVDKFGEGRIFLAGDSAHVHSPTGGQGLNTGIQDSFNLTWKLALVYKGLSPLSLLDSYNEERLPVIAEMLNQTTTLLNQTFRSRKAESAGWVKGGSLLQLGVNYRWSSIVIDEQQSDYDLEDIDELDEFDDDDWVEEQQAAQRRAAVDSYGVGFDGSLRAGDRAPDAPDLSDTQLSDEHGPLCSHSLFDLFGATHHTALVFVESPEQSYAPVIKALRQQPRNTTRIVIIVRSGALVPSVRGVQYVLEDDLDHASRAYTVQGGCDTVIVRPDGMVGGIVRGAEGVKRYFRRIFA
ncbi:FAD binding domain-containing protein [Schizophyllum amplum]|uniref:FAD binding domain-containing protein n=1 Tax=Schizophyllum amplum TaxID=97359 RepID=A0A550CKS0_9AGAR|nr:FAD binding domain-containing protein [Auriculariopsis ampla]